MLDRPVDVVVAGDNEQPIERDIQRCTRLLQQRARARIVGRVAPVAEVASEHDQIERHAVPAQLREVGRPLLAQHAPPEGRLQARPLPLRPLNAPHVQIGDVKHPEAATTHRTILSQPPPLVRCASRLSPPRAVSCATRLRVRGQERTARNAPHSDASGKKVRNNDGRRWLREARPTRPEAPGRPEIPR
jgi:hypothetical protein